MEAEAGAAELRADDVVALGGDVAVYQPAQIAGVQGGLGGVVAYSAAARVAAWEGGGERQTAGPGSQQAAWCEMKA